MRNGGSDFPALTKTLRKQSGKTQHAVAREIELATGQSLQGASVGGWERGEYEPRNRQIAVALDEALDGDGALLRALGYLEPTPTLVSHTVDAERYFASKFGHQSTWSEAEVGAVEVTITTGDTEGNRTQVIYNGPNAGYRVLSGLPPHAQELVNAEGAAGQRFVDDAQAAVERAGSSDSSRHSEAASERRRKDSH